MKKMLARKEKCCIFAMSNNEIINIMKSKQMKNRDLAKDAAFLVVICGEIRGLALKHVGCTEENVKEVNDMLDYEIEFIRKEIEQ